MFDLLLRYRRVVLLALLIAAALAVRALEDKDEDDYTVLDRALVTLVAPLQSGLRWMFDGVGSSYETYIANVGAARDNEQLRDEISDLRRHVATLEEAQRENHRLLALIGLVSRSHGVEYLPARVIGHSTSALFRSLRIDIGSDDGVVRGMGVVGAAGVVGRIMNVAAHSSELMLLVDAASSLDVFVARSRARGRLRGLGDQTALTARIDYVSRSADVEVGDTVLTTGSGKVFPKGLLVGWVTRVERVEHGLYQEVMIDPAAPLLALDELMVVKAFGPDAEVEAPSSQPVQPPAIELPLAVDPQAADPQAVDPSEVESLQPPADLLPQSEEAVP